jgi:hypothetical protein
MADVVVEVVDPEDVDVVLTTTARSLQTSVSDARRFGEQIANRKSQVTDT